MDMINSYLIFNNCTIRWDQIAAIVFNISDAEGYVNNAQVYLVQGERLVIYGTARELGELQGVLARRS
jgi:hypothetical protein